MKTIFLALPFLFAIFGGLLDYYSQKSFKIKQFGIVYWSFFRWNRIFWRDVRNVCWAPKGIFIFTDKGRVYFPSEFYENPVDVVMIFHSNLPDYSLNIKLEDMPKFSNWPRGS